MVETILSARTSIKYIKKSKKKAKTNTSMPETSCRKPWAVSAPICCAMTAVTVRRNTFTPTAMGIAEKKRIHLLYIFKFAI